jgi:hypothetical protein
MRARQAPRTAPAAATTNEGSLAVKLPLEFGIKLVFRLVFAGVILAAALVPAVHGSLHAIGVAIRFEYLFPIEVIVWGWAILISDMRIYMLFEGRRYWPSVARRFFMRRQQRRLDGLKAQIDAGPGSDRRKYLEAGVDYGLYPVDNGGDAYVAHPTMLGNIIESFETYPKVKYGLDSVFYWYRLWVVLDKDIREEIDNSQSLVDSTVYVTFALYASAIILLVYGAATTSAALLERWLGWPHALHLPYIPSAPVLCGLAFLCALAGFLVYHSSLTAHAQFGELFKSVFDQFRSRLAFDDVLAEVGRTIDSPYLFLRPQREKHQIVWRYLRLHRIRDEASGKNLTTREWAERREAATTNGTVAPPS